MLFATLLWMACTLVLSRRLDERAGDWYARYLALPSHTSGRLPLSYWVLLPVGLAAAAYVLLKGSFTTSTGLAYVDLYTDPIFKIAYQCSDLVVPLFVFAFARYRFNNATLVLFVAFLLYAVLVGFRYKIALLALPIALYYAFKRGPIARKITVLSALGGGALILFSVMTFHRVKFGVPDLTQALTDSASDFLTEAMGESNILFGMISITKNYADAGNVYPIDPFRDAIAELVPHFLWPGRVTGEYLSAMNYGLISKEGYESHTAYPWIGEAFMISGYYGLLWAPPALAARYVWLKSTLRRFAVSRHEYVLGLGLLAAMMGYYHFSRAYMPQALKGYIFVVAPYLWLCFATRSRLALNRAVALRRSRADTTDRVKPGQALR
jgi:hypothetical protein